MTPLVFLFALTVGHVTAGVVELSCSDNATCIESMLKETARSLRQQKTVRLFDALTIEPLGTRQARAKDTPLTKFTKNHAFSLDWNDYTFRVTRPRNNDDVMDLEVYQSRSAKDVSDQNPKKSSSKVEDEKVEDKGPQRLGLRRRQRKKVLMAVIPLLFGMKSAAVVIFAMGVVTVLTLKAFIASKMALLVTVGMAVKKLYESYTSGVGLQNHPYLYSQYPIDFPSASSHAYSVSGVSPQFASAEMYNPTAMGNHPHPHELLQQGDTSAQQSQQAPTLQLVNNTRASERWDGKSKLLKLLEPVLAKFRSFIDPIANMFYSMPATFRGLNSDVATKGYEPEVAEESVVKPKVILVPQPRLIAQRKTNNRKAYKQRPKKYAELKISLERLKHNKDLYDYIKTKKYKYNYPHTFYYPKVKFYSNPNSLLMRPNNNRLRPYIKDQFTPISVDYTMNSTIFVNESSEWKPIIIPSNRFEPTEILPTEKPVLSLNLTKTGKGKKLYNKTKLVLKSHSRSRRSISNFKYYQTGYRNSSIMDKGYRRNIGVDAGRGFLNFFEDFFTSDFMSSIVKNAQDYAKTMIKDSLKETKKNPPKYYGIIYDVLTWSLDMIDGYIDIEDVVENQVASKEVDKNKTSIKVKRPSKNKTSSKYKVPSKVIKKKKIRPIKTKKGMA